MDQISGAQQGKYFDLGTFGRKISTENADAQLWFNRGLTWCYGFNHDEAVKCFQKAIDADPDCAMAWWGLAYAAGPNYNKIWEMFDKQDLQASLRLTYEAAKTGLSKIDTASPVEAALIRAIQVRYPQPHTPLNNPLWNKEYANAMEMVYKDFNEDPDVASLYADACMMLTPWRMWDLRTGQPASGARTLEAKRVLEQALQRKDSRDHPGIVHLYIHLMEMSNEPEIALVPADRIRDLIPDSGHLCHMPSHLDVLVGDYRRSIASNAKAIIADEKYMKTTSPKSFYTVYRLHNYHSLIYAAMFAGQIEPALTTVGRMEASVTRELLMIESPPLANWLEAYLNTRVHVLIRFGQWKDIISLKLPDDQALYCVTTAHLHYGKALAWAATGDIQNAEREQELFVAAVKKVPKTRFDNKNRSTDVLAVAAAMLQGEIDYRRGKFDSAFEHLEHATKLDDALNYAEPWGWMQPTRHAHAALLLEQNHVEEALVLYRADLGYDDALPRARWHPNNVWALHGYHECLKKLGRLDEAKVVSRSLKLALATADVSIGSSCFCRLRTENKL